MFSLLSLSYEVYQKENIGCGFSRKPGLSLLWWKKKGLGTSFRHKTLSQNHRTKRKFKRSYDPRSYERNFVGSWSFVGSNVPAMNESTNEMIYERNHILNCGYEIK